MPFVTEEIWQSLPHDRGGAHPRALAGVRRGAGLSPAEEKEMERVMDAIRAIRNRRAEMNVPPSRKAEVYVETAFADTFHTACAPSSSGWLRPRPCGWGRASRCRVR